MSIDLTSGKGSMSLYNIEKIRDAFENYDMLITTDTFVLDTSKYNMCGSLTNADALLSSLINPSNNHRVIAFGKNAKGAKQIMSTKDSDWVLVRIYEQSIRNVTIKGKRNFLLNNPEGKKFT